MRIHCLSHASYEGPGSLQQWAEQNGYPFTLHRMWESPEMPDISEIDFLAVLGGPMSVDQETEHPWLVEEKLFVARAIDAGIPVIGICLGGQMIAEILGGEVRRNDYVEIGWWPVELLNGARSVPGFGSWPNTLWPFHWHSYTFSIPPGCIRLASSEACPNQAFSFDNGRVVGLQFHPEFSLNDIRQVLDRSGDDITDAPFIQQPIDFLDDIHAEQIIRQQWFAFLNEFAHARVPAHAR